MVGPRDQRTRTEDSSYLRASHADRDRVIEVLKAAFVQGRLDKDELDLRVGRVFTSRTYADLNALTTDLPVGPAAAQPPEPAREQDTGAARESNDRKALKVWARAAIALLSTAVGTALMESGAAITLNLMFVVIFACVLAGPVMGLVMLHSWVENHSRIKSLPQPPVSRGGKSCVVPADVDDQPPQPNRTHASAHRVCDTHGRSVISSVERPMEHPIPESLDQKLDAVARQPFRAKFHLRGRDRATAELNGPATIRRPADDLIAKRLAPAEPYKDGRQTPYRGHPVFVAQHATATCCRTCLLRWHQIPQGRELAREEHDYVVDVIFRWIQREMAGSAEAGQSSAPRLRSRVTNSARSSGNSGRVSSGGPAQLQSMPCSGSERPRRCPRPSIVACYGGLAGN